MEKWNPTSNWTNWERYVCTETTFFLSNDFIIIILQSWLFHWLRCSTSWLPLGYRASYLDSCKLCSILNYHLLCEDNKITFLCVKDCDVFFLGYICNSFQGKKQVSAQKSNRCLSVSWWGNVKHIFFLKTYIYYFHRLTDNLVALKEIRLEHEEGAPCTAIREGELKLFWKLKNHLFIVQFKF